MKYVYPLIVNYIIRDFNKISGSVIATNQPFVCIGFEQLLVKRMPHGIPDIGLCQAMLKSGFVEVDIRKHMKTIVPPLKKSNGAAKPTRLEHGSRGDSGSGKFPS
jgi:hypothetical protein